MCVARRGAAALALDRRSLLAQRNRRALSAPRDRAFSVALLEGAFELLTGLTIAAGHGRRPLSGRSQRTGWRTLVGGTRSPYELSRPLIPGLSGDQQKHKSGPCLPEGRPSTVGMQSARHPYRRCQGMDLQCAGQLNRSSTLWPAAFGNGALPPLLGRLSVSV